MVNARASWRRRIIVAAWVVVIGGLLWFLLHSEHSPLFPFGDQQNWAEAGFDKNDSRIPDALRVLKPSAHLRSP
jgi:hypothetical protein